MPLPRDPAIAVAARELEGPPRGVSRWLREVLAAWRLARSPRPIRLYVERATPPDFDIEGFDVRATDPDWTGGRRGATAWEQVVLARALRRDRPAVVLGPANSVPLLAATPSVCVLHDFSFEAHPEWFARREGLRLRWLARQSARRAARIVVVSEFTAGEVERRYQVPRERIRVAPNGVSAHFAPVLERARLEATRDRHGLAERFVLSVGSLFTRRRVVELIAGFGRVLQDHPSAQLVLVGDNRTHPRIDVERHLFDAGVRDRTRWIDKVSDAELLDLYSLAGVSVYLSDYEGFGLPPLEALACGAPVLASGSAALADNLTGHATLLAPDEHTPEAIGRSLSALLGHGRPPVTERPEWLERFSWQAAGETILATCLEVAR